MNKIVKIILSFPKTLFFNFRYLPIKQAIKLPLWVSYNTTTRINGKISLMQDARFAMIRIGFLKVPACNRNDQTSLEIENNGVLTFFRFCSYWKWVKIICW